MFQASYTYSKAIDQGASFENELNPLNFNATRGLSLVDARHRFVFSPYWELPIPKHDGVTGKLVNGWAASAIITYPERLSDSHPDAGRPRTREQFLLRGRQYAPGYRPSPIRESEGE